MEKFISGTGQTIAVHNKEDCSGNCPVHNPSDHHMNNWQLNWRQDLGIFERICSCGIGHPDPDSLKYLKSVSPAHSEGLSVHGCCGCCNEKWLKKHHPERLV